MSTSPELADVLNLAFEVHEGRATSEQVARLESLCLQSSAFSEVYREYARMCGILHLRARGTDMLSVARKVWQSQGETEDAAIDSPDMTSLAGTSTVRPDHHRRHWLGISPRALAIAASLLLIGYFVGMAVYVSLRDRGGRRHPDSLAAIENSTHVATLLGVDGVRWSADSHVVDADEPIQSGKPLQIDSGLVELQLRRGTKLVIQGPAEWTIDGDNRATLRQGKVVVNVPNAAIGFALETPTARIVDLGTEFGVSVFPDRLTRVAVFQGVVDVEARNDRQSTSGTQSPTRSQRLVAGESATIRAATNQISVSKYEPADNDEFVHAISRLRLTNGDIRPARLRLVSQGRPVSGSSSLTGDGKGFFPPGKVVDGRFDDLGTDAEATYWIAEDDTPADVIVDLESSYLLREIRLQNTHNSHGQDRGTKGYRLSVSQDGKTYRVVADGELQSAFGQQLISRQRVVLKTPVTARFVKFEALTWYGLGAGLSELQVWAVPGQRPDELPPATAIATIGYWQFDDAASGTAATTVESQVNRADLRGNANGVGGGPSPRHDASVPGMVVLDGVGGAIVNSNNTSSLRFFNTGGIDSTMGSRVAVQEDPDSSEIRLEPAGDFTAEGFVRVRTRVKFAALVGKSRAPGNNSSFGIDTSMNGTLRLRVDSSVNIPDSGSGDGVFNEMLGTTFNVDDGNWHHFAMTYTNATRTVALYGDYALVGSLVLGDGGVIRWDESPLNLGNGNGGRALDGWLDEVRYSTGALTPSQFLRAAPAQPTQPRQ